MNKKFAIKNFIPILLVFIVTMLVGQCADAAVAFPTITVGMTDANTPQEFTQGVQILVLLTILTLAPSIFIMTTAFIRIIIVLALTRQAIGMASLPPNQVLAGLALILTFFVMAPTFNKINETAIQPYMNNQITQQAALERGIKPMREFMIQHTEEKELGLFLSMAKIEKPKNDKKEKLIYYIYTLDIVYYPLLPLSSPVRPPQPLPLHTQSFSLILMICFEVF